VTVRDVEVHGVAARRLAGAHGRRGVDEAGKPAAAGPQLLRGLVADECAALVVVCGRQQPVEWDVDEVGIAVERLAVGEGELGALGDGVDVFRGTEAHRLEVEARQQGELLEEDRALPPRAGLADRVAVVLESRRRLDRRLPGAEVVACEEPSLLGAQPVDGLGHEAAVKGLAGAVDPRLAAAASRLVEDPAVRRGQGRVAEQRPRAGRRQVELGRGRPGP
jgi:hypothetical protein